MMPDQIWLGEDWETVDGMKTGNSDGHYIEYEYWPEGESYIRTKALLNLLAQMADAKHSFGDQRGANVVREVHRLIREKAESA